MEVTTTAQATIDTVVYIDGTIVKTMDCEIANTTASTYYNSYPICEQIDFTKTIVKSGLPKGKYRMKITFEKIN